MRCWSPRNIPILGADGSVRYIIHSVQDVTDLLIERQATAAAQQADAEAARCEGAHTPLLAEARAAAPLTARQRDIALMAAHGTASRDIAEELHLSVRTVENHLNSVYAKLGVSTRRELARALNVAHHQPHEPLRDAVHLRSS